VLAARRSGLRRFRSTRCHADPSLSFSFALSELTTGVDIDSSLGGQRTVTNHFRRLIPVCQCGSRAENRVRNAPKIHPDAIPKDRDPWITYRVGDSRGTSGRGSKLARRAEVIASGTRRHLRRFLFAFRRDPRGRKITCSISLSLSLSLSLRRDGWRV